MKHEHERSDGVFKMPYSIKREQIVFDWINTIEEFHCLLVSNIEDLRDGIVLVEIGKELMRMIKCDIDGYESDKMDVKERFEVVYGIINRINNDENICRKYDLDVTDRNVDEDKALILLAEIMRNQMEMIEEYNNSMKDSNNRNNNNVTAVKEEIENEDKQTEEDKKDDNHKVEIDKETIKVIDYDYKKYTEDMKQKENLDLEEPLTKGLLYQEKDKKYKLDISNQSNSNLERLSSKSLLQLPKDNNKASNNASSKMMIGIIKLLHSKLISDTSIIYLPYYKFYKPTSLIIDINEENMKKYTTRKHYYSYYQRASSPKQQLNNDQTEMSNLKNDKIDLNFDIVSDNNKTNIFLWLKDLHLIPKDISFNDIPSLCPDGLLLSNIINRNEGRFDTIKGINRVIKRESHIRANLKKILNHLRSKERFPSRALFSLNAIMKCNEQIIWCLLEDLWEFYCYHIFRPLSTHVSNCNSQSVAQFKASQNDSNILISKNPSKSYRDNPLADHNTQDQSMPKRERVLNCNDKSKQQKIKNQTQSYNPYMSNCSIQSTPMYSHYISNNDLKSNHTLNNNTTLNHSQLTKSCHTVIKKPQKCMKYLILEKNSIRKMKDLMFA